MLKTQNYLLSKTLRTLHISGRLIRVLQQLMTQLLNSNEHLLNVLNKKCALFS